MDESSGDSFDGFYLAYFTGVAGNSIGIFVFKNGIVVGADAGGGRYDGEYKKSSDGKYVDISVKFSLPVGNSSITGFAADSEPISIEVPFRVPVDFNRTDIHRIETPIGPINAKLEKIRGA